MSKMIRTTVFAIGLLMATGAVVSQAQTTSTAPAATTTAAPAASAQPANPNQLPEQDLGKASLQAGEGHAPLAAQKAGEEEENAEFKYSSTVKAVAAKTGLSKEAVYWIFLIINFVILAGGIGWVVKKALPNGFAGRNAEIKKGIEEARKASADATARLKEIEERLTRLDAEIAEIRTAAESDFAAEEQRIKTAAELDAKNVIAAAEQEIAAAARTAQRDLKAFVAGLAVDLAEKKVTVDEATDQALVRGFAAQLGKDGQ